MPSAASGRFNLRSVLSIVDGSAWNGEVDGAEPSGPNFLVVFRHRKANIQHPVGMSNLAARRNRNLGCMLAGNVSALPIY